MCEAEEMSSVCHMVLAAACECVHVRASTWGEQDGVCVCVCVCVRERERERELLGGRDISECTCDCVKAKRMGGREAGRWVRSWPVCCPTQFDLQKCGHH